MIINIARTLLQTFVLYLYLILYLDLILFLYLFLLLVRVLFPFCLYFVRDLVEAILLEKYLKIPAAR